jgi:hypothetical protein
MSHKETTRVAIATRLPRADAEKLAQIAAASERTVAQEMRHLVKQHIARQGEGVSAA